MAKPRISIVLTSVALLAALTLYVERNAGSNPTGTPVGSSTNFRGDAPNAAAIALPATAESIERALQADQSIELANDELSPTKPSVDYLESLAAFRSYLDRTANGQLDLENVVEFVNISDSAFELIASRYKLSVDPVELSALGDVISESRHESKVELALALLDSPNTSHRQHAYRWLNDGVTSLTAEEASNALLKASHHELDPTMLPALLTAFPLNRVTKSSGLRKDLIYRLHELAMHPDEQVAQAAILELAEHAPSTQTLQQLHRELQSDTEGRLLTALSGLTHFDSVDTDVMITLETLLNNPDLPRRVRAQAAKALVVFENERNASAQGAM